MAGGLPLHRRAAGRRDRGGRVGPGAAAGGAGSQGRAADRRAQHVPGVGHDGLDPVGRRRRRPHAQRAALLRLHSVPRRRLRGFRSCFHLLFLQPCHEDRYTRRSLYLIINLHS